MTRETADEQLLLQIVPGELPLTTLSSLGMSWHREGSRCWVENPQQISATVQAEDLARGLLAHRSNPQALREWALFIQAADLDLDLEGHPAEEWLVQALWGAAFLEPPPEEVVQELEHLVQGPRWSA
jgi:hypothetical protein